MFINMQYKSNAFFALILWIAVAKKDDSYRSSTYTLLPKADDKEPLQDILSEYQNCDGLENCGVSCLSNKWCVSFFHNSGQRRFILTSRQNVTLIKMTPGFAQYVTRGETFFPVSFLNFLRKVHWTCSFVCLLVCLLFSVEYFAYVESRHWRWRASKFNRFYYE